LEYLSKDQENGAVLIFQHITSHQGPQTHDYPDYKGSKYDVVNEMENCQITNKLLQMIAKDDPVICAIYAKDNGLMDTESWK
jgi:hypothetical protein